VRFSIDKPATVAVVLGWAKRDPSWDRYLAYTQPLLEVTASAS